MKVLSSRTGGRFANQLYFALQAFIRGCTYQTALDSYCSFYDLNSAGKRIGLSDVVTQYNVPDYFLPLNNYYQLYGVDFSKNDLSRFINKTIMRSELISECKEKIPENRVGIHIRIGDYLNIPATQCFDKEKYLIGCFNEIPEFIDSCCVYAEYDDDNVRAFDSVLKRRFRTVMYRSGPLCDDFCELACYKWKILWNSTFSFWTGFVSDEIFCGKNTVFCPVLYSNAEKSVSRCNPSWVFK